MKPFGDRVIVEKAEQSASFTIPDHMKKDGLKWYRVVDSNDHPTLTKGTLVYISVGALRKGVFNSDEFYLISLRDIWAYKNQ